MRIFSSPRLLSAGNSGTKGVTVEAFSCQRKRTLLMKRKPVLQAGRGKKNKTKDVLLYRTKKKTTSASQFSNVLAPGISFWQRGRPMNQKLCSY